MSKSTFAAQESTESAFQDWLDQCPVQWFLLDSDYKQKSYQFIIDTSEKSND